MKHLEPGAQLGRYELLTPIAQGGMAAVWAARLSGSHGFRKTVALKTMLPSLSEDPQFERMFLAEARLAMRMHHPNVVDILDLGELDGLLFLVMEWIDGEPLSALIKHVEQDKQGTIPLRLAAQIALKACMGLNAAHLVADDDDRPVGIVHRDVSPQNIMVSYDGQVKVVDFGVAKSLTEGGMTATGQFKGKVPYMAPEQAEGGNVDARTDIFAMGTLMYRMMSGVHPFRADNDLATLKNILMHEARPLRDIAPQVPESVASVVFRCLQRDPAARYPTMQHVVDALEATIGDIGPIATESEVATLMKSSLGQRRETRRVAMRDAARSLGWATATSESNPRMSLSMASSLAALGSRSGSLTPSGPLSTQANLTLPSIANDGPTRVGALDAPSHRPRRAPIAAIALAVIAVGALVAVVITARTGDGGSVSAATADTGSAAAPVTAAPGETATATQAAATAPATAEPSPADSDTDTPSTSATAVAARPGGRPGRVAPKATAAASTAPAAPSSPPPTPKTAWQSDGPDLGF